MIRYKNRLSSVKDSKANFYVNNKLKVKPFKNKTKARRVNVLATVYYTYKDFLDRLYALHFAMKYARGSRKLLVEPPNW